MMSLRLALPAAVVVMLVIAACGEQPIAPSAAPDGASLDSGLMLGSGNRSGSDTTSTGSATASSDTTGREGLMLGSGN